MATTGDGATKFLDLPLEARITADKRKNKSSRGGVVKGRGGRSIAGRGNFRDTKGVRKFPSTHKGTVFKSNHYDKRGSAGNRRYIRGGKSESTGRKGVSHSGRNFSSLRRGHGGPDKVPVGASTIDILQEHAKSLTKRAKDLQRVVDIARNRGQKKVRSGRTSRISHNSRSTKKPSHSGAATTRGNRSTHRGTVKR